MAAKAACADDVNKVLAHMETDVPVDKEQRHRVTSTASVVTSCIPCDSCKEDNSSFKLHRREQRTTCGKSRSEKEALRKRIYHQKIKDERNTLRKTVHDLTLKLEELKQRKVTNNFGLKHTIWQGVAVEEREKLLRSKAEQKQLLAVAKSKASCIMELCKHVAGPVRTEISLHGSIASKSTNVVNLPAIPPFDYTMFRGHLRRVHEEYTQTDSVLNFEDMADGVVTICKRRDSDNEIEYFERRQKFSEPFSYARTQQTMWKLGKLYHRQQNREDFGEVAGSDDISVIRYRVLRTLPTGLTVSIIKRYVARRFVENKRTVYVWKTHSEGEGVFCGMHSDETGWIRIQPGVDENVTDVLSCVRQVPLQFGISTFQVKDFHDLLQSSVHEDMTEILNSLNKELLEDTLAGIDI
ncbi:uncharacterized protein PHALS_01981 [Plasmopara halstedii]|uniref:M96 mating-specific protein family n=1 Tax=Plasmopara halstedii TaxID=4781 RepID=A0A0P1AWY6_PLAHL|nr:uncharacterized protein PHALS_01981 [Plasmopara halstedii]CEG45700.1 hypothetical protein PHALS_01981 [Plasmopara halstedii]|eukprot:XP_024582069.1 hypothetical protein PHALS_01981 [Plasmopara halstedii]